MSTVISKIIADTTDETEIKISNGIKVTGKIRETNSSDNNIMNNSQENVLSIKAKLTNSYKQKINELHKQKIQ